MICAMISVFDIFFFFFFNDTATTEIYTLSLHDALPIYPSLVGKWFGWWFLVWMVAYAFIYTLQLPTKGILDSPWLRSIGVAIVVIAASWLILALNGGATGSNSHLAIGIGGRAGLILLLSTLGG